MNTIDVNFVRQIDDELVQKDVKLHARPFHVAMEWMREKRITGDIFDENTWGALMETYRLLYPNGNFSIPAFFGAGVALRDIMYPVRVNVGYGSFSIDPLKCIDITQKELELIFQHYPKEGWRALYGVCDIVDFAYGVDDLIRVGSPAKDLLNNARSCIAATSRILSGDIDLDAAVQTTCLSAELSIKAALTHLGRTERQLKDISHQLCDLADALISDRPTISDDRLRTACTKFPNYVKSRYSSHGLTRQALMELAMRAQFVAADAIRRVAERNMAGDMEARPDCPPRVEL